MKNSLILIIISTALGLSSCGITSMTTEKVVGNEKKAGLRAATLNSAQYYLNGEIYIEWSETVNVQNVDNGKITVIDSTFKVKILNGTKGELVEKISDPVTGATVFKISFSKDHTDRIIRFQADPERGGLYYPIAVKWNGEVGKIKYGSSTAYMTGKGSNLDFQYSKKEIDDVTTEKGRDVDDDQSTKSGEDVSKEGEKSPDSGGSLEDQFEED